VIDEVAMLTPPLHIMLHPRINYADKDNFILSLFTV
jgi:hypothetical protein